MVKTVYNIYLRGKQLNSIPLSKADVEEVMRHDTIKHMSGRNLVEIPVKDIRIIKRLIM